MVLGGVAMSYALMRWRRRHIGVLTAAAQDPDIHDHMKDAYRFGSKGHVELLCRVMRKWDDDDVPDPDALDFGEFIIKVWS